MTAEIAILNRSALALAADSAVTIRMGNKVKIYDSAEKLFEFSRKRPIALMIYNNVEFVGVPLDVAIRKFRREKDEDWQSVGVAAAAFQQFLQDFPHRSADEKEYLKVVTIGALTSLNNKLVELFRSSLLKPPRARGRNIDTKKELRAIIERSTQELQAIPLNGYLANKTQADFNAEFFDVVQVVAKRAFQFVAPDDQIIELLNENIFSLIKSNRKTELFTGLVFGGFGSSDLFPTIVMLEIDGTYFGELRTLSKEEIDIDRNGPRTAIVPFAQQEMAERFIDGLDSQLEGDISKFVGGIVDLIMDKRPQSFKKDVRASIKDEVSNSFVEMMGKLKQQSRNSVLDIVYSMSKKELAEMAHALVELTSKKRRFSSDQETVGGPIDVAVVTRNEGLIWIQRKHYFDPALNPGYSSRMGPIKTEEADG